MDELEQRQQGKSLEDFFLEITADKNETEIPIVTESERKERVRARVLEEYRKFIDAKNNKENDVEKNSIDNNFSDSVDEIVETLTQENESKIDTNDQNIDKLD